MTTTMTKIPRPPQRRRMLRLLVVVLWLTPIHAQQQGGNGARSLLSLLGIKRQPTTTGSTASRRRRVSGGVAAGEDQQKKTTTTRRPHDKNSDDDTSNGTKTAAWISLTAGLLTILTWGAPVPPDDEDDDASAILSSEAEEDVGEDEEDLAAEFPDDELLLAPAANTPTPSDLSFEGVHMVLQSSKKNTEDRVLLDGSLRGRASPGRLLAIMGPSGAGKSTLLHAIAGRIPDSKKVRLEGVRYLNGQAVDGDATLPAALVEQDVNFFPHMTVRETLDFRVELQMGRTLSPAARRTMVEDLMAQMHLTKAADTIVGDAKVRGISGGERKRLSVAVELISSPSIIFLDEPTSGLDSTAATTLVQNLRDLADQGKTVIAVIHQPSQHVFSKFDDLLLLSEGKLMYFGALSKVRGYMTNMGYTAPSDMGTAEHVLDCISRQPIEEETQEQADARVSRLARAAQASKMDLGIAVKDTSPQAVLDLQEGLVRSKPKSGILRQFSLLLKRSFREVARGKTAIIIKVVQQVTLGLIYGGIYKLGDNQASIQDRFGLLSLIAIGSANMAVASTIRSFPREKAIVSKEISSNMYRTLPYFIGKAISELPLVAVFNSVFGVIVYRLTGLSNMAGKFRRFLGLLTTHGMASEAVGLLIGAISPNSDVALALFPAVLVLNIIFDGKNISEESTPRLLRWIPKVSLIRWGFQGLCLNEFDGLQFASGGGRRGPVAATGADALDRIGLDISGDKGHSLSDVVRAQAMITLGGWLLSYVGLTLTRPRFMSMTVPAEVAAKEEAAVTKEKEM